VRRVSRREEFLAQTSETVVKAEKRRVLKRWRGKEAVDRSGQHVMVIPGMGARADSGIGRINRVGLGL
jgi:hypothetical protein